MPVLCCVKRTHVRLSNALVLLRVAHHATKTIEPTARYIISDKTKPAVVEARNAKPV
jgi:hypothetical protein